MGLKGYIKEGIREIDEDDKRAPAGQTADKQPPSPRPTDSPMPPKPIKT